MQFFLFGFSLKQKWIEVTVATQVDVLIEAVCHGSTPQIYDSIDGVQRNTVVAVESVAKKLQGAGIKCHCYHQDTSLESAEVLTDFKQNGGVLVCTDAAACGVDIPNISHVIQAVFAKSAVDLLLRTGRTARDGQSGVRTCYKPLL